MFFHVVVFSGKALFSSWLNKQLSLITFGPPFASQSFLGNLFNCSYDGITDYCPFGMAMEKKNVQSGELHSHEPVS